MKLTASFYHGISGWWYRILDGTETVYDHPVEHPYRSERGARKAAFKMMDKLEKENRA